MTRIFDEHLIDCPNCKSYPKCKLRWDPESESYRYNIPNCGRFEPNSKNVDIRVFIKEIFNKFNNHASHIHKKVVYGVKYKDETLHRGKYNFNKGAWDCKFEYRDDGPMPLRFIVRNDKEKETLLNFLNTTFKKPKSGLKLTAVRSSDPTVQLVKLKVVYNNQKPFEAFMTDRFFYTLGTTSPEKIKEIAKTINWA